MTDSEKKAKEAAIAHSIKMGNMTKEERAAYRLELKKRGQIAAREAAAQTHIEFYSTPRSFY